MTDKIIVFFIIVIFGFLGFIAHEATKTYDSPKQIEVSAITTTPCDLQQGACKFQHPDLGEVTLDISPRPIKMNQELEMVVTSEKNVIEGWIDFLGMEMDMGFNRPKLIPQSPGKMKATGVLPTCTQKQMHWQTTVILKGKDVYFGAPFKFLTIKD